MDIKRSTDGSNPYAGRAVPVFPDRPVTKWDLISDREREYLEDQPVCPHGPTACSACGADVSTEGRFLRHYTLPDLRFWNLGNCPNGAGRPS